MPGSVSELSVVLPWIFRSVMPGGLITVSPLQPPVGLQIASTGLASAAAREVK